PLVPATAGPKGRKMQSDMWPLDSRLRGNERMGRLGVREPAQGNAMLRTIAAFERIGEENAFAVLARANALAAQGRDIINLGIGQPDFRTPDHIVEAAVKALRDGHHGYTPTQGIPPLREAVAADLHRRFGVTVSPAEVMVLPGWRAIRMSASCRTRSTTSSSMTASGMCACSRIRKSATG